MKIAAHPMVVLVALGLMGPQALASDPEASGECCGECDDAPSASELPGLSADEAAAIDALAGALSVAEPVGWLAR